MPTIMWGDYLSSYAVEASGRWIGSSWIQTLVPMGMLLNSSIASLLYIRMQPPEMRFPMDEG